MSNLKKIFLAGIFLGAVLGICDFFIGILVSPTLYLRNDIKDGISAMLFAQLSYASLGLIISGVVLLLLFIFRKGFAEREKVFSLLFGIFAGLFLFLVYLPLVNFHKYYLKLEGIFFALLAGIFSGVGIYYLSERFLRKEEKQVLPFYLWITLWILANIALVFFSKISLSVKKGLAVFGILGLLGLVLILLEIAGIRKRSLLVKIILAMVFLGASLLPWLIGSYHSARGEWKNAKQKTNIILVVADALRADALGVYGGKNFTPTLDSLAKEGLWFKNVISQGSYTTPSVASLFTSYYPTVFHYSREVHPEFIEIVIPPSFYTLAERLRENGYYTVGFFSNPLLTKKDGFLQGFEKIKLLNHLVRVRQLAFLPIAYTWQRTVLNFMKISIYPHSCKVLIDWAIKFLKKNQREPFFLTIYINDPHDPYDPPKEYLKKIKYKGPLRAPYCNLGPYLFEQPDSFQRFRQKVGRYDNEGKRFVKELYLAEVRYLDAQLARLIRLLKEQGLDKNTILIFTSDHGEEFWEHRHNQHGRTLYQELLKVPLIIWGDGIKHKKVEEPIELIDLVPSLLEFISIPVNPPVQGKSFWKVVYNSSEELHKYFFSQGGIGRAFYCVQDGKYKLIYYPRLKFRQYELYDLEADPGEKRNIFSRSHPAFLQLKPVLEDWLAESQRLREQIVGKRTISKEEQKILREKLHSLGYIK